VIPVIVLARWMSVRDPRRVAPAALAILVGAIACIAPWTIRNQIRMDAFVAISTNTGDNLCIGHNPEANGAFTRSEECAFGNAWESAELEVAVDEAKTRHAVRS